MKRVVVLAAALICFIPWSVFAQGFPGYMAAPSSALPPMAQELGSGSVQSGTARLSLLPGGWFDEGMTLRARTLIGYKKIGLTFDIPVTPQQITQGAIWLPQYQSLLDVYPLDFDIKGANLCIGAIELETDLRPRVSVFCEFAGSLPTKVNAETTEAPVVGAIPLGGPDMLTRWEGTRLQWWRIGVAGKYSVSPTVAILAGLRWERLTTRLSDLTHPVAVTGFPINIGPLRTFASTFDNITADLQNNLTIPYVGWEVRGRGFRSRFIIGCPSTNLILPARLTQPGVYAVGILYPIIYGFRSDISEEARYTLKNAGLLVEGQVEYRWNWSRTFGMDFWFEGSWLRIRGQGDVGLAGSSGSGLAALYGLLQIDFPRNVFSGSGDADSSLTMYTLGAGLSGTLRF